jgi:O-acetyl-ADP-ribose deacetylase (regulator of RNase III)
MALVDQHGFRSVAFPVLGAGSGGASAERALSLMLAEFATLSSPAQVRIVRFAGASA